MGKSAAANWAGRWARGGRPDPLLGSVPDRANNPKRRGTSHSEIDNSLEVMPKEDYLSSLDFLKSFDNLTPGKIKKKRKQGE